MTIKTLEYIHKLLIENEAKMLKAKEITFKALCQAEEKEAENRESLEKAYHNMIKAHNEAMDARLEFENRGW